MSAFISTTTCPEDIIAIQDIRPTVFKVTYWHPNKRVENFDFLSDAIRFVNNYSDEWNDWMLEQNFLLANNDK